MSHTQKTGASVRFYPIYAKNQPATSTPTRFVNGESAAEMVSVGAAVWFRNKFVGPSLRLTEERKATGDAVAVRDESCRMGPATMLRNAVGDPRAIAMVEAWA